MRDETSELRRGIWLLAARVHAQVADLDARIAAAELVLDSSHGRDLEQVYNAQHEVHGARRAVDLLVPVRTELLHLLDPAGKLGALPFGSGAHSE